MYKLHRKGFTWPVSNVSRDIQRKHFIKKAQTQQLIDAKALLLENLGPYYNS